MHTHNTVHVHVHIHVHVVHVHVVHVYDNKNSSIVQYSIACVTRPRWRTISGDNWSFNKTMATNVTVKHTTPHTLTLTHSFSQNQEKLCMMHAFCVATSANVIIGFNYASPTPALHAIEASPAAFN